ncbi:MAG: transglycosylase SLT domain-containing protein [Terriglobia bacterium]
MRFSFRINRLILILAVALGAPGGILALPAASRVSPALRVLAARARTRRGWGALARYARSARSPEAQGLAYFALGYREYTAGEVAAAAEFFGRAAATRCVLAGYAEYYEALADQQIRRDDEAIAALTGFGDRHPESVLRLPAENELAGLLIKAGRPEEALAQLGAEPASAEDSAPVLLLIAQADEGLQKKLAAAQAYEQIDISFPQTAADRQAQSALDRLRRQLGSRYPQVSEGAETERADHLYRRGLYRQALTGYDSLLLAWPHSPHRAQWRNRRAECFLALRQYSDALAALNQPDPKNAEMDAARLALRVRAFELNGGERSMLDALDKIYHKYPRARSYADALAYAAGYFAREGFWQTAARYYRPLAQAFPDSFYAPEAAWRSAWYDLLAGNGEAAQGALVEFLQRYPKSSYAPAALYWLASAEDKAGDAGPAEEIFLLLADRYASTYYGIEARLRLPKRQRRIASVAPVSDSALASLGVALPARPDPPFSVCGAEQPDSLLQPFSALSALSLDDLASEYLEDARALHPEHTKLLLALARSRASERDVSSALFAAKQAAPDYELFPFRALPRDVWNWLYPRTYWSLVRRYARANGIDPYLVMGIIRQESAFNPRALSYARARGLMQMEPATATARVRSRYRRRRIARSLYSPAYNIRAGCLYLRELLREFNNNVPQALAAYNAGDIRARLWVSNSKVNDPAKFLETIPFTDTRAYVEMVLRDRDIYRALLTGQARFTRCPPRARTLSSSSAG